MGAIAMHGCLRTFMGMRALGALLLLATLLPCGLGAANKDAPAMKMLQCDACKSVMNTLSEDVKYLVMSEKMWKPKDLTDRVQISCMDPGIPKGALQEACGFLMSDYHKAIAKEV